MNTIIIILIVAAVAVVAILWLRSRRNRYDDEPISDLIEQEEPPLINYYSRFTAESCITKNYTKPVEDKALKNIPLHEELWSGIQKLDKKKRDANTEKWIREHLKQIYRFGDVMAYIEEHPMLMDTFIDNIQDPDDLELQKRLISVSGNAIKGSTKLNYMNLLCRFCSKWEFRPEIKAIVTVDPRFSTARNVYELYRS